MPKGDSYGLTKSEEKEGEKSKRGGRGGEGKGRTHRQG